MTRLVVSLHDVAPPFESQIVQQMEALRRVGMDVVTLMVVPNWEGRHELRSAVSLTNHLREWRRRGCEVALHGYSHRTHGPIRGSLVRQLRGRLFAAHAAEFLTFSGADALTAVDRGRAELEELGLGSIEVFCPPGWLITDEAEDAVAEAGFRGLVGITSLQDLPNRRLVWLGTRGYMGVHPLHQLGASMLTASAPLLLGGSSATSVYLHPDPSGGNGWMAAVRRVGRMVAEGIEPATYRELLEVLSDPAPSAGSAAGDLEP